uniref:Uncharacterized protein n=1 Tax=Arundo donax TaxID=35708 RepID=A0A0A8ZMW2_ARUDO
MMPKNFKESNSNLFGTVVYFTVRNCILSHCSTWQQ